MNIPGIIDAIILKRWRRSIREIMSKRNWKGYKAKKMIILINVLIKISFKIKLKN